MFINYIFSASTSTLKNNGNTAKFGTIPVVVILHIGFEGISEKWFRFESEVSLEKLLQMEGAIFGMDKK